MKKSVELKKTVDELKAKVEALQANEQYDDAAKEAETLNEAVRDYKTALAIESAELENMQQQAAPVSARKDDKKILNRAFNKAVLGWAMTDEEKDIINRAGLKVVDAAGTPGQVGATPAKGGYLVPEEQMMTLREYRRAYTSLKDLCNVQTANSTSGKMPTIGQETGKLIAFEELNEINQDDLDFGQLTYSIADYGDIIPVSNQFLQDADINIMQLIGQRFARKSINTENEKILEILKALESQSVSNWKGITKALNVSLDPAISAGARILTNQDGLEYLDEMTDSQGRPLLTQSLADPTSYVFRGRPITVVSNALLASGEKKIPFYVGAFADMIAFFQRLGVEVAVSTDAGFTKYATYLRAVERFGVVKDDPDAVISLSVASA